MLSARSAELKSPSAYFLCRSPGPAAAYSALPGGRLVAAGASPCSGPRLWFPLGAAITLWPLSGGSRRKVRPLAAT